MGFDHIRDGLVYCANAWGRARYVLNLRHRFMFTQIRPIFDKLVPKQYSNKAFLWQGGRESFPTAQADYASKKLGDKE